MAKYVYPAIFTKEKNNAYSVDFPDVENCYTCGDSLVNAMEMASDVLAMMLCFREKEKKPIPVATPIKEIQTNADSFATLILCDTTVILSWSVSRMQNNIKRIREQNGITRKELAALSGVHYKKITDYENDYIKFENITIGNLNRIATALGVTLDELCREDSENQ